MGSAPVSHLCAHVQQTPVAGGSSAGSGAGLGSPMAGTHCQAPHTRFSPDPEAPRRRHSTRLVWLGFRVCFGQQVPSRLVRSHAHLLCSGATCLGPSLLDSSFSGDDLYIPSHRSEVLCCSSSAPSRRRALAGEHHPWWPLEGAQRELVSDGGHQAGLARVPQRGCPCRGVIGVHTGCLIPGLLPMVPSLW